MTACWRNWFVRRPQQPIKKAPKKRARLAVEPLEGRLTPATTPTFFNDNWNLLADNGDLVLSVGDTLDNANDTNNPGGITVTYGVDGFGTVTTSSVGGVGGIPGSVAGFATLQDAIDGTTASGILNVLEGTYDITGSASAASGIDITNPITLQGDGSATTILRGVDPGGSSFIDIRINSPDVIIQGFTLDFNGLANTRQIGGIEANGNPNLQNIHILGNVIELTDSDNNTFGSTSYGFRTGGSNDIDGLQINNNQFLANGPTGGLVVFINPVTVQPTTGIQFNDNTVSGRVIRGFAADGIDNVAISGNTLDTSLAASNDSALIRIMPFSSGTRTGFTITNNLIGTMSTGGVRAISIGNAGGSAANVALTGNTVQNTSSVGVRVNGAATTLSSFANNFIRNNAADGIQLLGGVITAATNNDLSGNTGLAFNNTSGTLRDASGNWWGSNVPATVAAEVSANVDFTPWLDSGTDTDLGTVGFQGDFSSLHVDDLSPQSGPSGRITEGIARLTGAPLTLFVHSGSYTENVDVNKALTFNPGDSPGIVSVDGNLVFSVVGSTLALEVNGTTPGPTGHDQINVTGAVDLNGADNVDNKAALTVSSTAASNVADLYDIITSGAGPVEGLFTNAGNTVVSTGTVNTFFISYNPGVDGVRLVSASGAPATTVYVDDDFAGFANGRFIADADPVQAGDQNAYFNVNAFDTIQAAIDAVAVGGTVIVNSHGPQGAPAGAYAESLSIAKELTLDGNGGAAGMTATAVVIDPAAGNGITVSGADADNVTIRDLRVTGGADGINASGVDNLTITNVQADANSDDGIELFTITGLGTLSAIVASNNGDDGLVGVSINTAGTVAIENSSFNDNSTVTGTGDGISLTTVGAVTFDGVTATGNDPGVVIDTADSWTDTDGNYSNNAGHGVSLIDITGAVSLTGTTANDNGADGINVASLGTTLTVSGITASGNAGDGLDIGDGGTTASINGDFSNNTAGSGLNLNSGGGSFSDGVTLTNVTASG
ncbi:MAG: right-handed parallel beta-helix repeat-containing protein, partial [Gemmataceae bacterium]|nr:right-handed parallel beta-helix repeat-containing protein [Gemmataceae bacterium]